MSAAPDRRAAGARHRGFGLVEVLVALAISAAGLLGEALLLRHCLAAQGAALRREQATALLAGIAEQVRMNAVARADYALPAGAPSPVAPACAGGAACAPAELAAADLAQWLDDIAAALPAAPGAPGAAGAAGAATVGYAPSATDVSRLDFTLYWGEPGATAPASMSLSLLLAGAAP